MIRNWSPIVHGSCRRFSVAPWASALFLLLAASNLHAQEPITPPVPPQVSPPGVDAIGSSYLPRDLSPWSMFLHADLVVQSVILGLAFASLVTWTVWLAKTSELFVARRRLSRLLATARQQISLAEAAALCRHQRGLLPELIDVAYSELQFSADISDGTGIKERIAILGAAGYLKVALVGLEGMDTPSRKVDGPLGAKPKPQR
jgi:biopolymer transport protein ExbB